MDSKYARIELFSIIYASIQIVYTIIQTIVIRSWSKKRANFVGKQNKKLVNYDDDMLKRYLTPSHINDDNSASCISQN